jgi:hypothetical protein
MKLIKTIVLVALTMEIYLIGWCPHQPKHVINDEFDASRLPISIIL